MTKFYTLCLILLMTSACSGLSTEPEIDHIIPSVPTQTGADFGQVVDINQGAQIFADNCVRCHGRGGAGDGQLVQTGQISMTADFTDPLTTENNSLQNWFETITKGRIYALMPPWEDALSLEERWAVALYTYTLAYTDASIQNGSQNYINQCSSCHGEKGMGSDTVPSLLGLVDYSDSRLLEKLTSHQTELGLSPTLADSDLTDIVHYLRLLSTSTRRLADASTIEPIATALSGTVGTIKGHVRLGTSGASLADDLLVRLHVYDNQLNEEVSDYPLDSDGAYHFDDVAVRSDLAYLISIDYEGWRFVSDVVAADSKQKDRIIDVTLYESSDDSSFIEMTSRKTYFNLTAQGLYVRETISLRNTADKMLIRPLRNETVDFASIEIPIPPNAQLQVSQRDASRFRFNQSGTILLDTYPVMPDRAHIIEFAYVLPFTDSLTLSQAVNYKINGLVQVYVEEPLLTIQSEQTDVIGNQQINGVNYLVQQVSEPPDIGQVISYQIRNSGFQAVQSSEPIPRNLLAVGLVLLGLVFTLIGGITLLRGDRSKASTEDIIQQIVELDKQFEAGKLDSSRYQAQRKALKAKIAETYESTLK